MNHNSLHTNICEHAKLIEDLFHKYSTDNNDYFNKLL